MYLTDVDKYLSGLMKKIEKPKPTNVVAIMAFAGSWSDMEDSIEHLRCSFMTFVLYN